MEDFELQILSGLTQKEWIQFKAVILRRFVEQDGKLWNAVLQAEWTEAKSVFEKRQKAAKNATYVRTSNSDRNSTVDSAETVTPRPAHTRTLTGTDTETRTEKKRPKAKTAPEARVEFEIPVWVDRKAFEGFLGMRRKIRKPVADEALPLVVKKLEALKRAGHDPTAVLNQSTMNSWQGLFEVKGEGNGNHQGNFAGKTASSLNAAQRAMQRIADEARGLGETVRDHSPAGEVGSEAPR